MTNNGGELFLRIEHVKDEICLTILTEYIILVHSLKWNTGDTLVIEGAWVYVNVIGTAIDECREKVQYIFLANL